MHANLDALLTATYVLIDDFLPPRRGPGRPPKITDAELITLALAQVLMGLPNDRQFLALAAYRLGHLFPYLPKQPGYIEAAAQRSPPRSSGRSTTSPSHRPAGATACACSTPLPSRSAPPARPPGARSWPALPPTAAAPATRATSGALASISCCASDGMPIGFGARPGQCARARGRGRDARAGFARRLRRARRQGLCRPRVRALHGGPGGASSCAPTANSRSGLAMARSAPCASGSSRSFGPARASCPWSVMGGAPCAGSACALPFAFWPSRPASLTTSIDRSAWAGTSAPTATDWQFNHLGV